MNATRGWQYPGSSYLKLPGSRYVTTLPDANSTTGSGDEQQMFCDQHMVLTSAGDLRPNNTKGSGVQQHQGIWGPTTPRDLGSYNTKGSGSNTKGSETQQHQGIWEPTTPRDLGSNNTKGFGVLQH